MHRPCAANWQRGAGRNIENASASMKQIPLPIGLQPQPSFDNFMPGANAAALQHLRALDATGAPVYLWGPGGSGKTHLLRGWAAARQAAGQRVGWFDAADRLPWQVQGDWAMVVIDRCDELAAEAQHAAFSVFVEATTLGIQVAAAGRLPPVDLALRDDLRTRLGWGHVFAIEPLPEAETRAALRRVADRRGIFLSDEVMDHLLTHFPRDLGHLMQLLDRLDRFALARARRITLPLLRQMRVEEDAGAVSAA
jgi:DnaA family protein